MKEICTAPDGRCLFTCLWYFCDANGAEKKKFQLQKRSAAGFCTDSGEAAKECHFAKQFALKIAESDTIPLELKETIQRGIAPSEKDLKLILEVADVTLRVLHVLHETDMQTDAVLDEDRVEIVGCGSTNAFVILRKPKDQANACALSLCLRQQQFFKVKVEVRAIPASTKSYEGYYVRSNKLVFGHNMFTMGTQIIFHSEVTKCWTLADKTFTAKKFQAYPTAEGKFPQYGKWDGLGALAGTAIEVKVRPSMQMQHRIGKRLCCAHARWVGQNTTTLPWDWNRWRQCHRTDAVTGSQHTLATGPLRHT